MVWTDPHQLGEHWRDDSGIEVSYLVYEEPIPARPFGTSDRDIVECVEEIGGRTADVRIFYSDATLVPGQYAGATWLLADGRMLNVRAISRDPGRKPELIAIVSSVRFREAR